MRKSIILALILLLALAVPGWAATYYVNGSGGNYTWVTGPAATQTSPAGVDGAPGDGSIAHPWATMKQAETSAAASGDIVYVASATYTEDDATFHCWSVAKGTTWRPDGVVTVRAVSTTSVLLFSGSGATNVSGDMANYFYLDGQGVTTELVRSVTATNKAVRYLQGTGLKATTGYWWANTAGASTIVIDHCTINDGGVVTVRLFDFAAASNVSITNCTFTMTAANEVVWISGTGTGGFTFTDNTITGSVIAPGHLIAAFGSSRPTDISRNNITMTYTTATDRKIIWVADQQNASITYNTISTLGTGTTHIMVTPQTAVSMGTATVAYNTCYSRSTSNFVIMVGGTNSGDVTGIGNNMLDGASIHDNTIYGSFYYTPTQASGSLHGLYFGFNKNGQIYNNYINGCYWGVVLKGAQDTWTAGGFYANAVVDCGGTSNTGGANVHVKGQVNVPVLNNTLVLNTGRLCANGVIYIREGDTAALDSTGTIIKNNILEADDTIPMIKVGNDGSTINTADVNYNMYYNKVSAATLDFVVGATTYANWTDWKAASYDANSPAPADPKFLSATDFRLQSTSTCIGAGVNVSLTYDLRGYNFANPPSIGAYEFTHVSPATIYVDQVDGNNSYDGLFKTYTTGIHGPIKTLAKAKTLAANGDTISFRKNTSGSLAQSWRATDQFVPTAGIGTLTFTTHAVNAADVDKPLINSTQVVTDHTATGWTDLGDGRWTIAVQTLWLYEDGYMLSLATDASCSNGDWFYNAGTGLTTYKPHNVSPANHLVERLASGGTYCIIVPTIGPGYTIDGLRFKGFGIFASANTSAYTAFTVQNCDFADCLDPLAIYGRNGNNNTGITIQDCTFARCAQNIKVYSYGDGVETSSGTIQRNVLTDCQNSHWNTELKYGPDRGGILTQNALNMTIQDNNVSGRISNDAGIDNWVNLANTTLAGNLLTRNYIHDIITTYPAISWDAYSGATTNHVDITFNIIANCPGDAIHVNRGQDSTNPSKIYNNTIYGSGNGIVLNSGPNYWTVKNNIVANMTGYYAMEINLGANNVFDYNNYFDPTTLNNKFKYGILDKNFADWQTAIGNQDANSITMNPLFVNPSSATAAGYKIPTTSPACNGVNVGLTTDFGQSAIPGLKGKYSMGAWQDESIGGTPTDLMGWFQRTHKHR